MNNNFPDYHNFPDRDKGEESFWPSFTDIMMVITMVFLLVSVMVITNNWKLVTDLQESMQAQRLAAERALDKEAKNHTLEDRMALLEQRLRLSQASVLEKQQDNERLSAEVNTALAQTAAIEKQRLAQEKLAESRQQQLKQRDQQVANLTTDRDKQLATLEARAQALASLQAVQESSQSQIQRLQTALANKQQQLLDFRTLSNSQQAALKAQLAEQLESLNTSLAAKKLSDSQLQALEERMARLRSEQASEVKRVQSLEGELLQLREQRSEDERKLLSLQGEFDTLDSKYQKLLRPARSSKGKHVVSVWFSKQGGRGIYRIRDAEAGEFQVVSRQSMTSSLAALKDKHGKSLYVKVIIPENSGLSYSEAWRFTTEMQRAYDYYYQDDE